MRRTLITLLSITAFALLALGIIVLASASSEQSVRLYGNPHQLIYKQLIWFFLGLILAFIAQGFDYHYFKLASVSFKIGKHRFCQVPVLTIILFLIIIATLVLVYVPGIGLKVNGSRRWLDLRFFRLQPSEFAKIVMIIAMSVWLDRIGSKAKCFIKGTFLSFAILMPMAALIICQSDLGATMVICLLAVVLMVVAGVNLKFLGPLALAGAFGGVIYVISSPNRLARVEAWLAGVDSSMEQADQLRESIVAIQRGGLTGVGFTHSLQKYRYLPESHTDFVFPIGAEEFGLIFSLIVVLLFVTILICGVLISCNAPDKLGRYMAFGLTFLIVFQGMFNLMVVTGLAPTKGIALPFFSYGGTSIFSIMIAVGMLINVGRHIGERSEHNHTQRERNAIRTI
ncbi:MAG: putative peptidoglycan glycosyltransferase FtsW [Kiritimatiellae bacterium]|jgi:cell division protein FtsW|nr:putative peptidoglycan glycosyltransferase FtsW [Kiritimatiellia bacterium]